MKPIPNRVIATFEHDGYIIEIEDADQGKDELNACWDVWLHNPRYGVKQFMFGELKATTTYTHLLDIIAANIDEYIAGYKMDVVGVD